MYEDTPQELVHDLFSEAVFGDHPLGRPVIGTRDVIAIGQPARARRATTARCTSAATSSSPRPATSTTTRSCISSSARRGGRATRPRRASACRRPLVTAPPPGLRFQRKDTEQYHVCIGAPGIARSDRRRFAASLLDSILGGTASSRLFQEIREKRGMAYAVYSFTSQYTDTGYVGFYVGTREENLAECLEIAAHEIADIAAGQPAPERARPREGEHEGADRARRPSRPPTG